MTTLEQKFDVKFVIAALSIGFGYAAIVAIFGLIMGKEAAGVAGVALTAIATQIFRKFETLRFRRISEAEGREVTIPGLDFWFIILVASAFLGIQLILGVLYGVVLRIVGLVPDIVLVKEFEDFLIKPGILVGIIGLTCISYLIGGFFCGKMSPSKRYMYPIIAAILALLLNLAIIIIPVIINDSPQAWSYFKVILLPTAAFWLIYVFASIIGARYGFRRNFYLKKV